MLILHTNDEHSHLLGDNPNVEYPYLAEADGTVNPANVAAKIGVDTDTVGGIVRRQHLIDTLRSASADPVLLVSAGDVSMGTIFHVAGARAAPDLVSMSLLGYDFMTLGNHEFDFGPDVLAATIAAADKAGVATQTPPVPIVASNIHWDDVQAGGTGSALRNLMRAGDSSAPMVPFATKVMPNGLKVGVIGLMGYDAALVAPAKAPIVFSVPSTGAACDAANLCTAGLQCLRSHCVDPLDAAGHVAALAVDAQTVVNDLRIGEKVDVVIALCHLGKAEEELLAQNTTGIDVIIGGHSHQEVAPWKIASQVGTWTTIDVQAGYYGRKLGQLALTVGPDGAVDFDPANSKLWPVDHSLDAEILGGSQPSANPPVLAPSFQEALTLTGGVIAPLTAALNSGLAAPLGLTQGLFAPLVQSDHDVLGELPNADSNLSHLVTDAERLLVTGGMCMNPASTRIVGVQANGVLRDSLKFGAGGKVSAADVFRVLPLGASPWEDPSVQLPGYPIVVFRLSPAELFAGIDVGLTRGLAADSFFLSYSGLKVTYDPTLPPFDPSPAALASTAANGRAVKIEMLKQDGSGAYETVYAYDSQTPTPWVARWSGGLDPINGQIVVVTNLYLAGFLSAFGLQPKDPNGANVSLPQTVLCQTMDPHASVTCAANLAAACTSNSGCAADQHCDTGTGACLPNPALQICATLPESVLTPAPLWKRPEAKEWLLLLKFLTLPPPAGLGGTLPSGLYAGAGAMPPRVIGP